MDPTLEEKQSDHPQQKQLKEGAVSQGISAINNLARARGGLKNPLGKIGSRVVAQTALRGFAAFLAGPGLPIVIAIISIFVFTLIIVGFGGAPPSEPNAQTTNAAPTETITPAIVPTETITPTPAAP